MRILLQEQIQEQLERLRELRGCVEKYRLQRDKKTENFLVGPHGQSLPLSTCRKEEGACAMVPEALP